MRGDYLRRGERVLQTSNKDVLRRGESVLQHQADPLKRAEMTGEGWLDVLTKVGSTLGRVAGSKVGQDVLGNVLPTLASAGADRLAKVIRGEGLMLAGQRGRGLVLAGAQSGRGKKKAYHKKNH